MPERHTGDRHAAPAPPPPREGRGSASFLDLDIGEDAESLSAPLVGELDRRNPGAMELIRSSFTPKHGRPLSAVLAELHRTIPQVISKRLDYSMSKRVLTAMLEDVVDEVQVNVERKWARKMSRHKVVADALSVFSYGSESANGLKK